MPPPPYPVRTAAVTENLLKRKWSSVILRHLAEGITDPAEISRRETDLSTVAMNERLRNMQRFSLITRLPRTSASSKVVDYQLTARGHEILRVLNLIEQLDAESSPCDSARETRAFATRRGARGAPSPKSKLVPKD